MICLQKYSTSIETMILTPPPSDHTFWRGDAGMTDTLLGL